MVKTTGAPVYSRGAPGATFEAVRGIPADVTWSNQLGEQPHLFAVDPTLHWANPNNLAMPMPPFPAFPPGFSQAQSPVPIVTHLHGGEVRSDSDGGPDAWFTTSGVHGPAYSTNQYHYPNAQNPTTLWYHDHALGMTRINVMAGLAGFYLLRDPADTVAPSLPSGKYDVPIAIQDRSFNSDGSLFFTDAGDLPSVHPYWAHMFFGDAIMVNGRVWPNFDVEPRQYRFRVLNGSNSRFYNISLSNGQSFKVIGGDGGYLPSAATVTSLLVAPGERADLLIDFSVLAAGTKVILANNATAPYPLGTAANPDTTGQIMQFTVTGDPVVPPGPLPGTLNVMPALTPTAPTRTVTLNENIGGGNVTGFSLNGQKWDAAVSELPEVGSTEEWRIVNLTADSHPVHLHLVQFQVVSRQPFDSLSYYYDWTALNGGDAPFNHPTNTLDLTGYWQGSPSSPSPGETGWKDTVTANPSEVTTIMVRWAPQYADPAQVAPGNNLFPFDPTYGPGYVWHCHILDHEDNEMMRPVKIVSCNQLSLEATAVTPYWESYPDYVARLLAVGYTITNTGSVPANDVRITASSASAGVMPVTILPASAGDIAQSGAPGSTGRAVIKYRIPAGVVLFSNRFTVRTATCDSSYSYMNLIQK